MVQSVEVIERVILKLISEMDDLDFSIRFQKNGSFNVCQRRIIVSKELLLMHASSLLAVLSA